MQHEQLLLAFICYQQHWLNALISLLFVRRAPRCPFLSIPLNAEASRCNVRQYSSRFEGWANGIDRRCGGVYHLPLVHPFLLLLWYVMLARQRGDVSGANQALSSVITTLNTPLRLYIYPLL
jgi:hypothetical protein